VNQEEDLGFAIETLDDPPVLVSKIGLWGRGSRTGVRRPDRLGRDYIGEATEWIRCASSSTTGSAR
jgi:hypothetical protein